VGVGVSVADADADAAAVLAVATVSDINDVALLLLCPASPQATAETRSRVTAPHLTHRGVALIGLRAATESRFGPPAGACSLDDVGEGVEEVANVLRAARSRLSS
jgi:hypothetical protein